MSGERYIVRTTTTRHVLHSMLSLDSFEEARDDVEHRIASDLQLVRLLGHSVLPWTRYDIMSANQ